MAEPILQLKIGGSTKTLAAWGITGGTLVTTAGGNDTLTLQTGESIDADPLIEPFTRCELTIGGTRVFVGWLDQAPIQAQGGAEGRAYTLTGPQRWLDQAHYLQDTLVMDNGEVVHLARGTASTVLNQRLEEIEGLWYLAKPTLAEQIEDLFTVVEDAFGNQVAVNTANLPNASLPEDQRSDTTCWSALQILLRWVPGTTPRWDYSGATPTMRFTAPGAGTDRTLQATAEQGAAISPRLDLLCKTVTVRYVQDSGDGRELKATETAGPSGDAADLGATREHVATITLRGDQCGEPEPMPSGLAAAFNAFASRLHNEGTFTLPGLHPTHQPGDAWTIAPPYNGPGTSSTPAQTITRDLFAQTTTIQIGPPGWLGIQEAYDLGLANRTRRPATDCANDPRPQDPELTGGPLQPVAVPESNDVRVFTGFVAGLLPTGMSYGDDPPFLLEGLSGSGVIYAKLTTDTNGEPTSADILSGAALPEDDDTHAHYPLGSFEVVAGIVTVPESSSGNLNYVRCPNWYSNPRTYTHTWSREGGL